MTLAGPAFTLLTRADCCLCAQMRAALHAGAGGRAYSCDIRDIDERADWSRRWSTRIPVLLRADRVVCEGHPDASAIEKEFAGG